MESCEPELVRTFWVFLQASYTTRYTRECCPLNVICYPLTLWYAYSMLRRCAMTRRPASALLFRDQDFICVDKPPDVRMDRPLPIPTSAPSLQESQTTMEELVSSSFPLSPPSVWRHCHQLDYSTSGCLLYAASKGAAAGAQHCFESRMTKKTYLALVEGWLSSAVYTLPGVTPLEHPPDAAKVPVPKRFHSQVAGVGKRREAGKLYEEVCNTFREGIPPLSPVFKLTWQCAVIIRRAATGGV